MRLCHIAHLSPFFSFPLKYFEVSLGHYVISSVQILICTNSLLNLVMFIERDSLGSSLLLLAEVAG